MANQPPFAEYPRPDPRPQFGPLPGVRFEAIGESLDLVRKDVGTWLAAAFVFFVVTYGVILPVLPFYVSALRTMQRAPTQAAFVQLGISYVLLIGLSIVAQGLLTAGMIGLGVRKLRGEYVNVGMIFAPFKHFGTMLSACLVNGLIVGASYMACVVPSLFFYPVLFLMPTVAFLQNVGPIQALSITFDVCKRHWLGLLALLFVMGLMVGVGMVFCIVPGLLAYSMLCVVFAIHYRGFFESSSPTAV